MISTEAVSRMLGNNLPFTTDQFLNVFEHYNNVVWPAQLFLYAIGILAVCLAIQRKADFSRTISFILALLWIWMGTIYHLLFFSRINRAALIFALFFVMQGLFFFRAGFLNKLRFRFQLNSYGIVGGVVIVYALITYPVLAYSLGHRYPATPTFGLPCPTAIFTFGVLLWTIRKVPLHLLVIPVVWSLIGFSAAISLDMSEDFGLLAAGVISSLLILRRDIKLKAAVNG